MLPPRWDFFLLILFGPVPQVQEAEFVADFFGTADFWTSSDAQLLLEGFQQDIIKLVDWVASLNPMLCVQMLGGLWLILAVLFPFF